MPHSDILLILWLSVSGASDTPVLVGPGRWKQRSGKAACFRRISWVTLCLGGARIIFSVYSGQYRACTQLTGSTEMAIAQRKNSRCGREQSRVPPYIFFSSYVSAPMTSFLVPGIYPHDHKGLASPRESCRLRCPQITEKRLKIRGNPTACQPLDN